MNAPARISVDGEDVVIPMPEFLKPREPAALFAWWSSRRLTITKDGEAISLSADDLRALFDFVEANRLDEQLERGG